MDELVQLNIPVPAWQKDALDRIARAQGLSLRALMRGMYSQFILSALEQIDDEAIPAEPEPVGAATEGPAT
jgi:hypothetical protein